jgi:hypothetical protein
MFLTNKHFPRSNCPAVCISISMAENGRVEIALASQSDSELRLPHDGSTVQRVKSHNHQ